MSDQSLCFNRLRSKQTDSDVTEDEEGAQKSLKEQVLRAELQGCKIEIRQASQKSKLNTIYYFFLTC